MKKLMVDIDDIVLIMGTLDEIQETFWYLDTDTGEAM